MKLIGVMGNIGSGKTTFTEYFETKPTVGVIHIDSISADIKKKYFRLFLQNKQKNSTENTKNNPKVKTIAKAFFYKNKLTFDLLMLIKNKLIEKEIEKRIYEFKLDGKKVIVIENWALPTHKKLFKKFNQVYVLKRKFTTRRQSLKKRDNLTIEEAKLYDLPYSLKFIKIPEEKNVSYIDNCGSIEDLYAKAEEVYQNIGELSFDEKYSLKEKINFRDIAIKLGKLKELEEKIKD